MFFRRIYEKIFLFTSEITTVEDSTEITCDAIFFMAPAKQARLTSRKSCQITPK